MNVVHVTHEAAEKIGGIGAVIAGLVNAEPYRRAVSRTILIGPLLHTNQPPELRLGEGGRIFYSSVDGHEPPEWRKKFSAIERTYDVGIIYGTRMVHEPCTGEVVEVEVLLIDVFSINQKRLSLFKGELWKKFAIPSDNFESAWEFEQYVRLAEPGYEALSAIGWDDSKKMTAILAHEYMGVPTALQAVLDGDRDVRTVFYAHEVASVRPVLENTPGHDTMFYNVLSQVSAQGKSVEDVFPSVLANYKHPLVKAARYLDHIFAVGDYVVDELRFVDKHIERKEIDLVYNGIPAVKITLDEKVESRERMRQYAENLLGQRPTWVMGHVCRPVVSKAIWRDLGVLHGLEPMLLERDETAVFFMLGTLAGQRRERDIAEMERVYGWPVAHEKGYPDLCGGEEVLGEMFDCFNRDHTAVRAVLVNQWDWSPEFCGRRMPEGMTFADIRRGTDVEFGLSAYEPFGISQFEALCFGAICLVSNVCGCMGFARRSEEGSDCQCVLEGDFLRGGEGWDTESLLSMRTDQRDAVEAEETARLARELIEILPRDSETMARQMRVGYDLACRMSWDCVVRDYFLPALVRAAT